MTNARAKLGQRGEQIAAEYLQSLGYVIVARNVRVGSGELDIVARDGDCLVFAEVRTRSGHAYVTPEESITPKKQRTLIRSAMTYLLQSGQDPLDWRIDVIAIVLTRDGQEVRRLNHIESAVHDA